MPPVRFIVWIPFVCLVICTAFGQTLDTTRVSDTAVVDVATPAAAPDTLTLDQLIITFKRDDPPALVFQGVGSGVLPVTIDGEGHVIAIDNGTGTFPIKTDHRGELFVVHGDQSHHIIHAAKLSSGSYRMRHIPLWLSILPPIMAIALALIFREVIISLFVGIWSGAFIAGGMRIESPYYMFMSLLDTMRKYIVEALADTGHLSVILFSLLIGGTVGIITKNGGMAGVVRALARFARDARSTQFVTWLMGIAIFFDDYANTLIVGNTMRSMTDKFRISREKLAYIVDSTAAPVAAVAFITTWIGAELGYIDSGIAALREFPFEVTPYAVFIASLKYSFYPVLTMAFILILVYLGRDFGPMLRAEVRARTTGQVSSALTEAEDEPDMEDLAPVPGAPLRWYNAAIPVAVIIGMTMYGLVDTGMEAMYGELLGMGAVGDSATWGSIWSAMPAAMTPEDPGFFTKLGILIGNADSYVALLWASLSGAVVAILLTVGGRITKLFDTMHYMVMGFKTMMPALIILSLAWALAITTQELHTADYLTSLLSGNISPYMMPAIVFVLSAAIAFSTGSSWSTMAILYPIAIPTTWAVCISVDLDPGIAFELLLNVIATVLAASVLGDHCSPISDTTIMSSLASDCNHIDHVRTQLPYALTVGLVSLVAGTVSTLLGGGLMVSVLLGCIALTLLFIVVRKVGRPVQRPQELGL